MRYNDATGIDALMVVNISQAAAEQRAGRAGRTKAGKCYRLFRHHFYDREMEEETEPEIKRVNMCSTVLLLKTIKFDDILTFPFLDRPSDEQLLKALVRLRLLGALNPDGELTDIGRQISQFPLDPSWGKFLYNSVLFGCLEHALSITAMMSVEGIFTYPMQQPQKDESEASHKQFFRNMVMR
eukprot:UN30721